MPRISDLLGLDCHQPGWEIITAMELRPGDLVKVAVEDLRLVETVSMNHLTGEVEVGWPSGNFTDLGVGAIVQVKRQRESRP
ncbi:MAG: hypothetical protein ACR2NG_04325 [Acidimicrobiia bacterium]